jgi:hypothetical protein
VNVQVHCSLPSLSTHYCSNSAVTCFIAIGFHISALAFHSLPCHLSRSAAATCSNDSPPAAARYAVRTDAASQSAEEESPARWPAVSSLLIRLHVWVPLSLSLSLSLSFLFSFRLSRSLVSNLCGLRITLLACCYCGWMMSWKRSIWGSSSDTALVRQWKYKYTTD